MAVQAAIMEGMKKYCADCPKCGRQNVIAEDPTGPIEDYQRVTKELKCKTCRMTLDLSRSYTVE
jgi:hypothetical protein